MDILEAWSDYLWESERRDFERSVNAVFSAEQCSWLLVDTRIFRVDRNFIETEVIEPAFAALAAERYRGALDELSTAMAELTAGQYKPAVLSAARSFESVAKAILNVETGNASQLIRQLRDTSLFSDLPAEVAAAFPEAVFAALPFLRNRLAGHGQGRTVVEIPSRYAELTIHLAAVYDLFLVRVAADQQQTGRHPEATDDDEVPF